MARMDWAGLERDLIARMVEAITAVVAAHPDEHFYAAGVDGVYADGTAISMPVLSANTEESLAASYGDPDELRWRPADWAYYLDAALGEGPFPQWEEQLRELAAEWTMEQFEAAVDRLLRVLVRAARKTRKELLAAGVVDKNFVVIVRDDDFDERCVKACLSKAQVQKYFPQYDAQAVERERLRRLPEADRMTALVELLVGDDGPIGSAEAEEHLRAAGVAAVPALLPLLREPGKAWQAARMLGSIAGGDPPTEVLVALEVALRQLPPGSSDQLWAARALAALGRLDVVLRQANELPVEAIVAAVEAPYSSWRDEATSPLPLNYRPLEEFLAANPEHEASLRQAVVGSHFPITADEGEEALRGLGSPHATVRRHAASALGDVKGGTAPGARQALSATVADDPDPVVRRLALLSLSWRRRDARQVADVLRDALHDPDETVRAAAQGMIREHKIPETATD